MTTLYRLARDRASRSAFQILGAIIVAGIAAVAFVGGSAVPAAAPSALPPVVGVFTGRFDRGIPVYRLPSISVSADRGVAARDARALRAREGHKGEAS
jgi:hypothetical protein